MKAAPIPRPKPLVLPESEIKKLDAMYVDDGAWTPQEAHAALGVNRTTELTKRGFLGRCDTHMGPVLLLAPARAIDYGTSGRALSLSRQIDRAYIRRSLLELCWTQTKPGETAENLWQYDTTKRMIEVRRPQGVALLTGAIRSGGIGRQNVANIARRWKSNALFHEFKVIRSHQIQERDTSGPDRKRRS